MITGGDETLVAICFWSSGDWRREGGAFSFLVKRVAAAPLCNRWAVLDCGGKRSATPLSRTPDGLRTQDATSL